MSGDDADHRPPAPLRLEDKIEADGTSQQMQLDGWAVDEKQDTTSKIIIEVVRL